MALQNLVTHRHPVADDVPGVAFDPHPCLFAVVEPDLDRHPEVGDDDPLPPRGGVAVCIFQWGLLGGWGDCCEGKAAADSCQYA
jgi:hypothetical protein